MPEGPEIRRAADSPGGGDKGQTSDTRLVCLSSTQTV